MVVSRGGAEVGIDLASTKVVDDFGDEDYVRHFKDIFHPVEFELLESISEPSALKNVFTHFWALKEGYTKKLGVGLNGSLKDYAFYGVSQLKNTADKKELQGPTQKFPEWQNDIKLRVFDEPECVDIHSTMIDDDIVVSVCQDGKPTLAPKLVQIPLETLVAFFESHTP